MKNVKRYRSASTLLGVWIIFYVIFLLPANCAAIQTLAQVLSQIGSATRTLTISDPILVTSNTTVPANVSVVMVAGGSFDIDNGVTLTFNGSFTADLNQLVFSQSHYTGGNTYPDGAPACCDVRGFPLPWGGGNVRFVPSSTPYISPKWYGAKGDGAVIDAIAFFMASDSCSESGIAMWLPKATYLNPYVRIHKKGYSVKGNNSTFINNGAAQWNPLEIGGNMFMSKGDLWPGVVETLATDNLASGAGTMAVVSTSGFNVGDWVMVHAGTEAHSGAGNYIPYYKEYKKIASKTSTQLTFETPIVKSFLLSDDLRVTQPRDFPENIVVEGIIIAGDWNIAIMVPVMSGMNVTLRDSEYLGNAGWGFATFSHNVLFDHILVRGAGGGGVGRGVDKMTIRDSWFEPRVGGNGVGIFFEENVEDLRVEGSTFIGGIAYSNNGSINNKLQFTNNRVFGGLYFNGAFGLANIFGNQIKGPGGLVENAPSPTTKYMVSFLYTGEDPNTRAVFSGNTFEATGSGAMLYGTGTGGGYSHIRDLGNVLINILPDNGKIISNPATHVYGTNTEQKWDLISQGVWSYKSILDGNAYEKHYVYDNVVSGSGSVSFRSAASKAFLVEWEAVGRGVGNDNVYFLYKAVSTVSVDNAITTTLVVPTVVSSVGGSANASAVAAFSTDTIALTVTVGTHPINLVMRGRILNPGRVQP